MIFCFQEDRDILKVMLAALDGSGFEAQGFHSAKDLLEELDKKRANLVIADVTCQKDDGGAVLCELRRRAIENGFSILGITTGWMKANRMSGIEFEDEVLLFKPFNVTQLMQAVNKALRAGSEAAGKVLAFGNIRYEVDTKTVAVDESEVRLTKKEYALLYLFMDNTEQVFTREQIFNLIWESEYLGESRTVDVHVGTLRRKLGSAGKYIKTLSGRGYCMREIE